MILVILFALPGLACLALWLFRPSARASLGASMLAGVAILLLTLSLVNGPLTARCWFTPSAAGAHPSESSPASRADS